MSESRYTVTYFSHDHDLVALKIKLFDSLPEDNFGMPIRIHLIMQYMVRRSNQIKGQI